MGYQLGNRIIVLSLRDSVFFGKFRHRYHLIGIHRNRIIDGGDLLLLHMIPLHDILSHPVGYRHDMSGEVHVQPPAESGVGNLVERMILRVMSRLQIMNGIHISDPPVQERPAVNRNETSADAVSAQQSVLTEKLPQNTSCYIRRLYVTLQQRNSLILRIMCKGLPVIF